MAVTKRRAKRALLRDLAAILNKDDDLIPNEYDDEGPEYNAYDDARNELIDEFERRAEGRR